MPASNAIDQMIVDRMRELAPEYTDRREMITGKYESGTLLADPASGLDAGYVWAHDANNRNSVPVVVGPGMGDYSLVAAGVRVKTGLNRYGERVAIEPAGDSQNAAVVAQLQAAAAAARPVAAANITGGRVAPAGSGLDIYVEALDEVGWVGGNITGDSGDLPTGSGEYCWWVVYIPAGSSTPTYAASTPELPNTLADLTVASAFAVVIPPGGIRLQAIAVFTGETDITKDNTRILEMRSRVRAGSLLSGDAVLRTLASGVLTVGSESIVRVAAESGTADDWQQVAVSGASRLLGFLADTGDTITAKEYASGSDNLYTYAGTDLDFTGEQMLFGWWDADDAVLRILGGGGGGAFTDLTDTPASYSGAGDQAVFVNAGATALEFRDAMPVASKTRMVGTPLYDNTLGSSGVWDVSNSTFADYDFLEIYGFGLRSTVSAVVDVVQMFFGTGGGALDTTATNYSYEELVGATATANSARGNNSRVAVCAGATSPTDTRTDIKITLSAPGSGYNKTAVCAAGARRDATTHDVRLITQEWENTGAIDRIGVRPDGYSTDNFASGGRLVIIGYKEEAIGGVAYSTADVSNPPTDAELDAAFGAPATLPVPFTAIVNDNDADTAMWLVASNGTSWWYSSMTKAT